MRLRRAFGRCNPIRSSSFHGRYQTSHDLPLFTTIGPNLTPFPSRVKRKSSAFCVKVFLDLADNHRLGSTALPSTTVWVYSGGSPTYRMRDDPGRNLKLPAQIRQSMTIACICTRVGSGAAEAQLGWRRRIWQRGTLGRSPIVKALSSFRRMSQRLHVEHWIPVPVPRVFAFFSDPHNLPRIMPPSQGAKIVKLNLVPPRFPEGARPRGLEHMAGAGTEITFKFRAIPYVPIHERWTALITEFAFNEYFCRHPEAGAVQVVAPHPHFRGQGRGRSRRHGRGR